MKTLNLKIYEIYLKLNIFEHNIMNLSIQPLNYIVGDVKLYTSNSELIYKNKII